MELKLKYQINTKLKYYDEKEKCDVMPIILGNGCICIQNNNYIFIFDKKMQLIQKIDSGIFPYSPPNMIAIENYPNLFAIKIRNLKYKKNDMYYEY